MGDSVGTTIDKDLAEVKATVAALKAKADAEETALKTWFKAQWPHFVTWGTTAWLVIKHAL